jgi:glycosyltransferase involved in cell wall biosynthesis
LSSPIDILFAIPRLGGGGAERVLSTLLIHLDRARFRPALALQHRDGEYMDDLPGDVELLDLGGGHLRNRLPRLLGQVWRRRPAIVFTTQSHVNLLASLIRPLFPRGTALVAREASIPSQRLGAGPRSRVKGWLYRRSLPAADLLICQSRDMAADLIGPWGFPPARVAVVHNPVDIDRIQALAAMDAPGETGAGARVALLAAGRLDRQKGHDLLLDALARLPDRYHLTILGDGPERSPLLQRTRDLGLAGRVRLVPFTANPYPAMARADALVLSSRHEGFPNVLLEAGACGTPVIAFRCPGGVDEIIREGETGLMVDPLDIGGLAEAIAGERYLAMDPARITASIRNRFSLEIIVPAYEELLLKLARR